MNVLLVAEQNNDLLLKNHNLRQTGSLAIHEANATTNIIHQRQMLPIEVDGEDSTTAAEVVEISVVAAVAVAMVEVISPLEIIFKRGTTNLKTKVKPPPKGKTHVIGVA